MFMYALLVGMSKCEASPVGLAKGSVHSQRNYWHTTNRWLVELVG